MKEIMLLKKICSIYANEMHFATVILPFIKKEVEENTTIRTILEKDEQKNIEKVLKNVGLNSDIKKKIADIQWNNSNIKQIRKTFQLLKQDIEKKEKIDIIVLGSNLFIQKVNQAIDLWVKNNINILEKNNQSINVINCFSFEENSKIEPIIDSHDYILKTIGIEEIEEKEKLPKAN